MITDSVVDIFRRTLEIEDVTADSDFFALGGDSLVATRVLCAIARVHGTELTIRDLEDAPSPGALAQRIAPAAG